LDSFKRIVRATAQENGCYSSDGKASLFHDQFISTKGVVTS
jgi:hypothetical protein